MRVGTRTKSRYLGVRRTRRRSKQGERRLDYYDENAGKWSSPSERQMVK
jgi:hypothetical protein